MRRTTRAFLLSLCITLLIFGLIAGLTEVKETGDTMFGAESRRQVDSGQVMAAAQTADNALKMFSPVTRAAVYGFLGLAGWVAGVC